MTPADQIYSLPTNTGAAKLAYAMANNLTVQISHMAIGDGNGAVVNPTAAAPGLVREVHRAQLNQLYQHPDNPNWLVAELVIPAEVGGWTIREIGLYDVDGDLIFVGNHAEQYKPVQSQGSDETKTVRMVILVSSVAAVTLKTEPSTVMATIKFVNDTVAAAATEATQAEAEAGVNNTRKMTPLRVFQAIAARVKSATDAIAGIVELATSAEVRAGTDTARAVTPAGLAAAGGLAFAGRLLHVRDEKASGTDGGTFTNGAWRTRDLNTVKTNEIAGASLAGNQLTLPAGSYYVEALAPAQAVNCHKARLFNLTTGEELIMGTSEYGTTSGPVTKSQITGRFVLAGQSVVLLEHMCQSTDTLNGFGIAAGFAGGSEVYSELKIWKVA